jgi:hypothetical protein
VHFCRVGSTPKKILGATRTSNTTLPFKQCPNCYIRYVRFGGDGALIISICKDARMFQWRGLLHVFHNFCRPAVRQTCPERHIRVPSEPHTCDVPTALCLQTRHWSMCACTLCSDTATTDQGRVNQTYCGCNDAARGWAYLPWAHATAMVVVMRCSWRTIERSAKCQDCDGLQQKTRFNSVSTLYEHPRTQKHVMHEEETAESLRTALSSAGYGVVST